MRIAHSTEPKIKYFVVAVIIAIFCAGCSTKEQSTNKHVMSDELDDIQKAKDAVKLADSVNTNITNMADSLIKQEVPVDSAQ